jgi:hypothetical protein
VLPVRYELKFYVLFTGLIEMEARSLKVLCIFLSRVYRGLERQSRSKVSIHIPTAYGCKFLPE